MAILDLNQWIDLLEKEGELARITTKVDWNLELGGITQETFDREGPALLFENIKDHENTICRRFFTGTLATYPRVALMLGLPKETPYKDLIDIWRQRSKSQIKPKVVETGPVKENISIRMMWRRSRKVPEPTGICNIRYGKHANNNQQL